MQYHALDQGLTIVIFMSPDHDRWGIRFPYYGINLLMILNRTVITILTRSMEVMGMNILLRLVSILISPGSLPNQFISQGAKYITIPIIVIAIPAIII